MIVNSAVDIFCGEFIKKEIRRGGEREGQKGRCGCLIAVINIRVIRCCQM